MAQIHRKDYAMIIERCRHPRQWFVDLATGRIVERPCAQCAAEQQERVDNPRLPQPATDDSHESDLMAAAS